MAEAVETAQEVAAYEPEEDETVTAGVIKKALNLHSPDDGLICATLTPIQI
jgi:hypothetical protein